MRLASFGLALAALTAVSACAPYAGTYGYTYQTAPAVGEYGYSGPVGYGQPYAEPAYAEPYYGGGAVIVGTGGPYGRRRDGWVDDRRGNYRRDEGPRVERYGNGYRQPDPRQAERRAPDPRQPDQRQRPVFANQPAPAQPPRANVPPPPAGGQAFQNWSNHNVNNTPGPQNER